MKKIILNIVTLLVVGSFAVTACKKKTSEPEPTPTPTTATTTGGTPAVGGFTWTPSGGTATVADSAFYYQQYNTIHAFKNGSANHFEINLTALTIASYSVTSSSGNALTYVMGTTYLAATSGQINITANASNKLSGNFSTPLSGGSITSVNGQFVDIPKK